MSRLEAADKIEGIVRAKRHSTEHRARAVSSEQQVYILHSEACLQRGIDLRECSFSIALDRGIDPGVWEQFQDVPVVVGIDVKHFDLEPLRVVTDGASS